MKVEIAESVILSWLRHAQGCVVTQMNWKPSPTWAVAREPELNQAFDAVRSFASGAIGVQIFKRCDFRQFLRQTEIDVLGLRWADSTGAPAVIAVETAFHENGLQYGGAAVPAARNDRSSVEEADSCGVRARSLCRCWRSRSDLRDAKDG